MKRAGYSAAAAILSVMVILSSALSGCGVSPDEVRKGEFDPGKVAYFKDVRTEICFAVVSYNRVDTGGKIGSGISIAAVPCSPKVESILRQ